MADIVISIASKVAELLVAPIGKHICYPFKYKSNLEELKKQVEKLTGVREMVQHNVDEAKTQGDEIEKVVEKWLNNVDYFTKRVVKPIIDDENKAGKLCSIGFFPNLITRYSLSKKATKTAKDGIDLLGGGTFQKVSYRPLLRKTTSIYTRGYDDFYSRKPIFNNLMEALKEADVSFIGLYGMGGVGKTTLVKRVVGQAIEDKLFDVVVMAEVTEIPDIRKIQGQIADELCLRFQEESLPGRAARLRERMKKEKKILLILDNVWAKLDLESIGIPSGGDEKGSITQKVDQEDNKRQCKILLTSRNLDVLRDDMNTQKNFLVENLSDVEGENLFWKTVGYSEEKSELKSTAVEIVGKCAGLPLAINTIANALKNKSISFWKNALDQLKRANPKDIKGMDAEVYSTIELSYKFLETEEAKSLFLLYSLCNAGYGIHVTDLLKYGLGMGLFQGVYTLEEARNKLNMLIDYLKTSCLLMDGDGDFVKMHDIIHAVAVSIASTSRLWFNLQDAAGLKEMLEKKLPKHSAAVSLLYRDIYELPERMEFPKLELFLLYMNEDASLQIPDAVFEGMKGLKVLDMTGIQLLSPPSSLCCLINLHTLCLDRCQLGDVAIIGELKELEILSFQYSDIEQLPEEIRQLTRLRMLDLSNCSNLKVIKPNVISSLTRLEDLRMGNSFVQWDVDGRSNASLVELKQLLRLTALDIHVLHADIIPQDLSFEKLERYRIFIGDVWDWSGKYESSRTLKLKLNSGIHLRNEIKNLLSSSEEVYLDKLNGVKNVVYELNGEGFPELKHLHIQNSHEVQYVIDSVRWGLCSVFPRLESLFLNKLINLEKICHGRLATESFSKLRIIKVRKCDALENLFSFSMAKNLLLLQEIEVIGCKKLEEIIFVESEEDVHQNESIRRIEFTQLRSLTLQCLPRLTDFAFNAFTPNIGSQEILAEDEYGVSMSLFSENVVLPSLQNLKLSSINIGCTWLDQLPVISSCCQALTNLTLEECNGLKFLFSYSIVQSLVLLEILEIRNCNSIEEIINTEELTGEGKLVFSKLIKLQLKGLPNLTQFGSRISVEFSSMTQLSIEDCPKLKTFSFSSAITSGDIKQSKQVEEINGQDDIHPLFNKKVVLPTLASLNLSSIRIETIWHNQFQPMFSCFQNLTNIIMDGCDTVKYVFSSSMVESLIQLKVLEISNCKFMEVVTITAGERISSTLFPKLYRLHVKHLPKLTSFCKFAGNSFELPSLAQLSIENCPKMLTFVSNYPHSDMPASMEEYMNVEENLHSHIQPFFDEKVQVRDLKFLRIDKMDNMRQIWHYQLPANSFSKMDSLGICNCHNLLNIFPSNMLGRLQKLEKLCVGSCDSLEEIIGELKISSCTVEEIVAKEEDICRIVFPQLTRLELTHLPSIKRFYPGLYISEWPKLKILRMWVCNKVKILTSEFFSLQEIREESQLEKSIQEPMFIIDKVLFPKVEQLALEWNWIVEEILHEKFSKYSYNLKVLELMRTNRQSAICPCCFLCTLPNLEKLDVYDGFFEEIFICDGHDCKEKHVEGLSKLNYLRLGELEDSLHLWEENSLPFKVFQNLTTLEVSNCNNLKSLVPSFVSFQNLTALEVSECSGLVHLLAVSVAKSLVQLTRLKIIECKMIENIIAPGLVDEMEHQILFNQLIYLELHCLPRLTSFCSRNYTVEFPSLQKVVVRQCPNMKVFSKGALSTPRLHKIQITEAEKEGIWEGGPNTTIQKMFTEMVGFGGMEKLTLSEFPHLKQVWHNQFPISFFSSLKSLVVDVDCSNLKYIFTPSVVLGLVQLQELEVKNCAIVEAIIVIEEEMIDEYTLFPNLNRLDLKHLPKLSTFCNYAGNSIELPSLAELCIENCPNMEIFVSSCKDADMPPSKKNHYTDMQPFFGEKVVLPTLASLNLSSIRIETIWHNQFQPMSSFFQNLTNIIMDGCDTVKYVFSSSMVESLIQLKVLEISNCKFMEVVTITAGERISSTLFPKLYRLHVKHLPKLTSFCKFAGSSFELPSLARLWIENCPKMLTFVSNYPHSDMPASMEEYMNVEENLHSHVQPFFDEKVQVRDLKSLRIDKMDNMKQIWHYQLATNSFSKMDSLKLYDCHNLVNVFPSNMLGRLQKLEELSVGRCNSLEEIIGELKISSCTVEEIIGKEEDICKIVFSQLTWLELTHLPSIKRFYPGLYISEWPKLKKLRMWVCNKVKILTSEFLSLQEIHEESQLEKSIQEPLFIIDKVPFPKVEQLALEWNWIVEEILHEKFSKYSYNLKVLELMRTNRQSAICPCCFLCTLPNLEKLDVYDGFFEEIFICDGHDCKEKHVEGLSKLNYLRLGELEDSLHLWEENSLPFKVFQNLTTLEVSNCNNLKSLVPSFVSFQNLTALEVSECNGLVNLLAVSVAKSLVQLTRLKITECKMIENIIAPGWVDEIEHRILFDQLIYLELYCLPRLTSFCSGNYTVEFPSLQQVVVRQCPNMKVFSKEALCTPSLHKIQISEVEKEGIWEGSLNTTIHKMFEEMVGFGGMEKLTLSEFPFLKEVWHNQFPISFFSSLKSLVVDIDCSNLKYIFTPSVVLGLVQLQELEVKNCAIVEAIIVIEEEMIDEYTLFPNLNRLDLKHLPKLSTFCNYAGNSIELPSLAELCIENCPNMEIFVSSCKDADMPPSKKNHYTDMQPFFGEKVFFLLHIILSSPAFETFSSAALTSADINQSKQVEEMNCQDDIHPLFDQMVRIPDLKVLGIHKMDNIRQIWHHQLAPNSFSKIDSFKVYDCHNVLNIFPSNMIGRLQKLEELSVRRCNSLEEIFGELKISSCKVEEIVGKEEGICRIVFPQLTRLELADLSSIRRFYPGLYISELPKLKKLRMWGCNQVKILTSEFLSLQEIHEESQFKKPIQEPLFIIDKVLFPKVEQLALEWNWIVEEILHKNFSKYSYNLKVLELIRANKQSTICPCCLLCTLPNLERLDVYFGFFEEIFICEGLDCKEKHLEAPSKLNQLKLSDLKDSLHLWEENSLPFEVFRNLTTLKVSNCNNLKSLVPSFVSFQNLTALEVSECSGLVHLLVVSVANSLVQLTRLKITECKMIENIIAPGRVDEMEHRILFNQLLHLELYCLPRLTSFCSGNYTVEFPSLQQVIVRQCPNMKVFSKGTLSTPRLHKIQITEAEKEGIWEGGPNTTIQKMFTEMVGFGGMKNLTLSEFPHLKEVWHSQFPISSFSSLKSLVVDIDCSNLKYIFTPSVALGLVQLQELEVKNSSILEAIIFIEEEMIDNALFPNLNKLDLKHLPKLSRFCNYAGNSIELPSLAKLWIDNCPNMEIFISGCKDADMPASKENLHTNIQPFFGEKVQLPNLKVLQLYKMEKLRKTWHHQLVSDSFCKLEFFELYKCHNVLNVFPSNMLGRLQKLEELWLNNCSSLDEIFELQASSCEKTQAITATQLRKLGLYNLPKLKHVWDMDSQGLLTCQNLLSIEVTRCDTLKSILPASVGRNLLHLEELWIENCSMVEEIFAKEEELDEAVPRFPQLTFLRLADLSTLRSFYPGVNVLEWPMLKRLQVWNCNRVEISASKFLSFLVIDVENQHEMPMGQPPLLLDKVPLTNLESLGLDWKWFEKEALHKKLPEYSCKLKFLTINGFHKGADICVFCFLHKLPNLEKLQVAEGFYKEVFLCEGLSCEEEHVEVPRKLNHLRLVDLADSLHLWEENSLSSNVFQNLAILEVVCCGNIQSLVPSSVSFQNLTTLEVLECNELLNLMAVPTAKSLVQLTKLIVSKCKMIEEIITHEGDEVEDRIIFKKLSYLELQCLPSLTSFYFGNYTIEFPSLIQVSVRECPNMKIFSRGVLSAPRLCRIQTIEAEDDGFWEGNLNTTIQHMFIENGQSSKED